MPEIDTSVKQESPLVKPDLPDFVNQFSQLSVEMQRSLLTTLNAANSVEESKSVGQVNSTTSLPIATSRPIATSPPSGPRLSVAPPVVSATAAASLFAPPAYATASTHHVISAPLPRLSQFSGDVNNKGDVSYQQWKCELLDLSHDHIYTQHQLSQCVRRSLRGTAADVLLHLGDSITVSTVFDKFDNIFGDVLPSDILFEQFYTARQKDGESVATWACRLEDVLVKLRARDPLAVSVVTSQGMVRSKFWSGLYCEKLKGALRHRFDGGATYNELLVAARVAELESTPVLPTAKPVPKVNQQTSSDTQMLSKMDALMKQLSIVQQRLEKLEQSPPVKQSLPPPGAGNARPPFRGRCFKCHQLGHKVSDCLN
jgi:hypothetical protein